MYRYNNFRRFDDRFFGGGFVGPFILGGITGSLIASNRPNNFYPYPIFFSPFQTPYNQFNYVQYQNW